MEICGLKSRGFSSTLYYSSSRKLYHGYLDCDSRVGYAGITASEAVFEFHAAIDRYIERLENNTLDQSNVVKINRGA
jgi:hypothetical protein